MGYIVHVMTAAREARAFKTMNLYCTVRISSQPAAVSKQPSTMPYQELVKSARQSRTQATVCQFRRHGAIFERAIERRRKDVTSDRHF